jgi:hypothetical protein
MTTLGRGCVIGLAWLVLVEACGAGGGGGEGPTTSPFMPTSTLDTGEAGTASTSGGEPSTEADATTAHASTGPLTTSTAGDTTGEGSGPGDSSGGGEGLDPPAGGSSGGSGGGAANGDVRMTPTGVTYRVIAPGGGGPLPAMVVYSGTEGGATMTSNLLMLAGFTGNDGTVFAVLDGVDYNGDGMAGADVLDHVRAQYDVDNDRTYLLSESAGTTAGLELGLELRQSYFAAYWANDVNASRLPQLDAAALGFAPFGNAGPGGDFADADAIVGGMEDAGYRTPEPSPYDGTGAGDHGSPDQFIAALQWFPGRTRQ